MDGVVEHCGRCSGAVALALVAVVSAEAGRTSHAEFSESRLGAPLGGGRRNDVTGLPRCLACGQGTGIARGRRIEPAFFHPANCPGCPDHNRRGRPCNFRVCPAWNLWHWNTRRQCHNGRNPDRARPFCIPLGKKRLVALAVEAGGNRAAGACRTVFGASHPVRPSAFRHDHVGEDGGGAPGSEKCGVENRVINQRIINVPVEVGLDVAAASGVLLVHQGFGGLVVELKP